MGFECNGAIIWAGPLPPICRVGCVLAEVTDADARDAFKPQQSRRLDPRSAVEHEVVPADEDGHGKAQRADRPRDVAHVCGIEGADRTRRRAEPLERDHLDLERGQRVVAQRTWPCGGLRQARLGLAPATALHLQLFGERAIAGDASRS